MDGLKVDRGSIGIVNRIRCPRFEIGVEVRGENLELPKVEQRVVSVGTNFAKKEKLAELPLVKASSSNGRYALCKRCNRPALPGPPFVQSERDSLSIIMFSVALSLSLSYRWYDLMGEGEEADGFSSKWSFLYISLYLSASLSLSLSTFLCIPLHYWYMENIPMVGTLIAMIDLCRDYEQRHQMGEQHAVRICSLQ